jgi:hypothetical protein
MHHIAEWIWAPFVLGILYMKHIRHMARIKARLPDPELDDRAARRSRKYGYAPQADPETDRLRDEVKTLKERIIVLERIATEDAPAKALDREIEKLR